MTGAVILGFLIATGTTLVSLLLGVAYVARRFDDDLL
jgi:hypothetical protein